MTSSSDTLSADIRKYFGGDLEDDLVSECVKVCQANNLSGESLFYKWEATRFNRGPASQFTLKDIHDVRAQILREVRKRTDVAKKFTRGSLSGPQSRGFAASLSRTGRPNQGIPTATPVKPAVRPQDGFNMSSRVEKKAVAGPSRVEVVPPAADETARQNASYRYMYEKVSERSEVLDDRIDHFGELVKDYYNVEELGDPAAVTEEDVVVVGRVVLDAESSAGSVVKLNEASLMLESSRMMGSGARILLRFDANVKVRKGKQGSGGQGFFPGAIVAVKGRNGGGGWFLVTEILSLPPLEPPSQALIKSEAETTEFSMHIACGPFTPDGDVQFRHFQSLIAKLKAAKPAVVLLVGPFIDASHPLIKIGDVDSTPVDMFRTVFYNRLLEFLDSSPGSHVLLVPSTRDILSNHAVFPQPELGPFGCIHMLPNPARFTLNGVHFAATSVDVLFHLRKEEYFKPATEVEPLAGPADPEGQAPSDAMANLCRHVLQQRSFYPIFPVPLDLAHELSLDVSHSDLLYLTPQGDDAEEGGSGSGGGEDPRKARCAPDVLIVPSRLKHFSKVVDHTIAVNPSFLTKSTYAVLEYAGHTAPGPAKDKIKVEIERVEL